MLTNRSRETLFGEKTDSLINNRSPLIFGNSDLAESSNADWFWNDSTKTLELRLDWHLINVTDPAKRAVLDDQPETRVIEYSITPGFNMYLFVTDKNNKVIAQYPTGSPYFYTWQKWNMPTYTERLKPLYDSLKTYFYRLNPKAELDAFVPVKEDVFAIAEFFNNKKGAVSLSFENLGSSQYEIALPILETYNLNATFGIIPELMEDMSSSYDIIEGTNLERLGYSQIKDIRSYGNEVAIQAEHNNITTKGLFVNELNTTVQIVHNSIANIPEAVKDQILFNRKSRHGNYNNVNYSTSQTNLSQLELNNLLKNNIHQWTIFNYYNLFKDTTSIQKVQKDKVTQFFISEDKFARQVRLIRNSGYWIAKESDVFKYIKEQQVTRIETHNAGGFIFFKAVNNLDSYVFDHPLTISYKTNAQIVKISGSAADGLYTNRTGTIVFNAYPNKQVKIEIINVNNQKNNEH
jgi:peptidoglycan/xylan/chitin deacetylase (PgdA/CDA1 family)